MTNSAGAVQNGLVLRLSLPVSGEMADLGPELAAKLAGQLGVAPAAAARLRAAMADLPRAVSSPAGGDVEFEFHKLSGELKVVARHGERTAEARVPLNA